MRKKSRLRIIIVVIVMLVAAIGVFLVIRDRSTGGNLAAGPDLQLPSPSPKTVAVYVARRRDLARTMTLSAELTPYNTAKLYAKVSGYLQSLTVDYGSIVHAGEIIARLEVPEQQAEVERAQAAYNLAKLDYSRISSVDHQTPGLIAQQDVDQASANYEMAKQELDRAQALLNYDNIVAPFAGVVTKRNVDPGALIQEAANSASAMPVVEIAEEDRLRLVFEAPESIVTNINVGTPVVVNVRGSGESFPARVARLSYEVHEDTRTMHTEVDVPNAQMRLKPGMYADVTVTLARRDDAVAIPTQALVNDGSPSVIIVDKNHRLQQKPVTIGLQTPDWVQITRGVHPGDEIFIGNPSSISIGDTVKPKLVASVIGAN